MAVNNVLQQPERICITYFFSKNAHQNFVIDAVEKLPDIAFKNEAGPSPISTDGPQRLCKIRNAFVGSFANTTRKGSRDEGWFENRIQDVKNRVVQDAISHLRLVDSAQFWIMNPKGLVWPMSIRFIAKLTCKIENFFLDMMFEESDIRLVPLAGLEDVPCGKQIFC